jgi:hypothetical protein
MPSMMQSRPDSNRSSLVSSASGVDALVEEPDYVTEPAVGGQPVPPGGPQRLPLLHRHAGLLLVALSAHLLILAQRRAQD